MTTKAAGRPGLGRSTALMASGTAVSRVLGFIKGAMLVYAIGLTGNAANAFAVGNKLPNILYLLIAGGVLNAVLVPQVVRAYQRPGSGGDEYVNRLLTVGTLLLVALAVLLTLAAPVLVAVYTSFNPRLAALAVLFAYWALPQVFFYGMYTLIGEVLNARGSFGPLMWAPVANNVVAIAGLVVYLAVFGLYGQHRNVTDAPGSWTGGQVALLAGITTLGVVAQAVVLLVPLFRNGFRYTPRWGFEGLGEAGRVASWTIAGLVVGQLGILVVTKVASAVANTAGGGRGLAGNAVYDNALLVFMLPHSLVTVSLLTALFTGLSARAAANDVPAVRADLSFGLRLVGLFTVIAAAVLVVLAFPLARVLQPGATVQDASALAAVIVVMLLGLPAYGAWAMGQRVFYAYADARSMFPIQIAMSVIVAVGSLLAQEFAPARYWVAGAGLSTSVSYVVGALMALLLLRRRLAGIDGRGRAILVSVAVGLLMTAIYVGLLKAMRVPELDDLLRRMRRFG
jgi:putative peptidoglycan lipid II flippase